MYSRSKLKESILLNSNTSTATPDSPIMVIQWKEMVIQWKEKKTCKENKKATSEPTATTNVSLSLKFTGVKYVNITAMP